MYIIFEAFLERIARLTDEEHNALSSILEQRSYGKYEKLNRAGEVEEYFHFISKGLVRKYSCKNEMEITIQLAQEGQFISADVAIFSEEPTRFVLETIEPTMTFAMRKDRLLTLYYRYPGIQKLCRKLLTNMLIEWEDSELEQVIYSLRERMQRFIQHHPNLVARVPQKILASYLNIQPETYSRLKTSLSLDVKPNVHELEPKDYYN